MVDVGKLDVTTTEQNIILNSDLNPTIIIATDLDCEISINDNQHYQTYKAGEIIPLQDRKGKIERLYYKTLVGSATVRYWLM